MEIDLLLESQHQGIDLVGPVPSSKSWQDRVEGAYDHTQFHIDWEYRQVTCPQGKVSIRCTERKTWRGTPNFVFTFDNKDCLPCPVRAHCSRAKNVGRTLTLYPQEQYEAQLQARKDSRQKSLKSCIPSELEWKARFRKGLDGQACDLPGTLGWHAFICSTLLRLPPLILPDCLSGCAESVQKMPGYLLSWHSQYQHDFANKLR